MTGRLWSSGGARFDPRFPEYRYLLWREVAPIGGEGTLLFVMLNPSTADEHVDDPTIRRCIRFAVDLGYRRLEVVNLYGLRATDPDALRTHGNPVGSGNDHAIEEAAKRAKHVIVAWGDSEPAVYPRRSDDVLPLLLEHGPAYCLGRTASGAPRHPLYVAKAARLDLYKAGQHAGGQPPAS